MNNKIAISHKLIKYTYTLKWMEFTNACINIYMFKALTFPLYTDKM